MLTFTIANLLDDMFVKCILVLKLFKSVCKHLKMTLFQSLPFGFTSRVFGYFRSHLDHGIL